MIPNGVGQESAWTPEGVTYGWQALSVIPPAGDTSYIESDTANQEEACELSAPSGISGVYCISVVSDQRQDTAGGGRTTKLGYGDGTTREYGSAWGLGTSYVMNTTAFSYNAITDAAWELVDTETLQVCVKLAS